VDLPLPINQTAAAAAAATATATATASAAASPFIPPVSIQPQPTTVRPIMGQLDIRPINIVRPIME